MIPFVASLVMVSAAGMALAAIAITVRAQLPALRQLIADSRALATDREFLVQITATATPAAPRVAEGAAMRPRRPAVRLVKAPVAAPASTGQRLRAAA